MLSSGLTILVIVPNSHSKVESSQIHTLKVHPPQTKFLTRRGSQPRQRLLPTHIHPPPSQLCEHLHKTYPSETHSHPHAFPSMQSIGAAQETPVSLALNTCFPDRQHAKTLASLPAFTPKKHVQTPPTSDKSVHHPRFWKAGTPTEGWTPCNA